MYYIKSIFTTLTPTTAKFLIDIKTINYASAVVLFEIKKCIINIYFALMYYVIQK